MARTPRLHFVDDREPGFRRRRCGRGFTYLDTRGHPLHGERQRARLRALAIPPAWTDVWICPDPNGHLQATGRDDRGRKQYRYHAAFRAQQEEAKFDRMLEFGESLPLVRRRVAADLAGRALTREKVLGAVVHLLETTMIRVGNEQYARSNRSFGLTTLRGPQVHVRGAEVRFSFAGKSGRHHEIGVHDARAARVIRRCQDLPGQHLFQYLDEEGEAHEIGSTDVNEYLRSVSGEDFTAKDFRTWMGTLMAAVALSAVPPPPSRREARRTATAAMRAVGRHLGNTATVARSAYVHPRVIELFTAGTLPTEWDRHRARDQRWMTGEERTMLGVLRDR